jgi:hypothetical protein
MIEMKFAWAIAAIAIISGQGICGPFGVFGKRGGSNGNNGGQAITLAGFLTAQDAANHMARISRIGHFGGNRGYEGVGMGSTAYAAEMACCYRQRMQPREVGLAQNASGVWFACCRY